MNPNSISDFAWHEALDRSCLITEMIDRYLLFHSAIDSDPELKEKVSTAHQLLFEVYQQLGKAELQQQSSL